MLRKIGLAAAGLLVIAVVVGVWLDVPRFVIGILTYGRQAREGTLQVGDPAPVVSVYELDGTTTRPLADWVGARPLVVIFGSFT